MINVKRGITISEPSTSIDMGVLLEGNANDDNIINIQDFGILAAGYGKAQGENGYDGRADFDCNDIINIADFGLLAANYAKSSPITVTQPVLGGVYHIIASNWPQVLGYAPDMGPDDFNADLPMLERLLDAAKDRSSGYGLEPVLASSVDTDIAGNKFIFHIRPGVKFHDGSDLNAEVVVWNFQLLINAGHLEYLDYFKAIKIVDNMTVEIDFNQFNNQLLEAWGTTLIFSKTAYDSFANGDLQTYRDWAASHVVGTGPFMLQEFVRDNHLFMVKNPHYWRPGQPYLDSIQVRYTPDAVTAQAVFQSGQADEWDGAPVENQAQLVNRGYIRVSNWAALPLSIWPNTADSTSIWNRLYLREALEYALDKTALAKVLGCGFYTPLTMLAPPGEWGYDPNYQARSYDPAKAKFLLAADGFPNGLATTLLILNDSSCIKAGTAIKAYLDAVGIQTTLDIADPGRFYGAIRGFTPPQSLSLMWTGMDVNYLTTYMHWFSTDPFTNMAYLGHTADQQALDVRAGTAVSLADQKAFTTQIVRYMADRALVIPLYKMPSAVMVQNWVHCDRFSQGFNRWQSENTWMDQH